MSAPNAVVDLIYVQYLDGLEMSCAIVGGGKDKLLGPVPSKDAVLALAPMLQRELPERFPDVKAAETHLMFVHFQNMSLHHNSAGQDYPFKINSKRPAQ